MFERANCNVCSSPSLSELLNLGKHPLADTFLNYSKRNMPETCYPLVLAECDECGHVFTKFHVSPEERYILNDYSYDSSNSPVAEKHFKEFAENIIQINTKLFGARKGLKALDFGSNVGTLLSYLKKDVDVIGVEPSPNISKIANENGIPSLCTLFNLGIVSDSQIAQSSIDIVLSTNVVNHMDDLAEMMRTIDEIGKEKVMFAFEVPYLVDLIKQNAFDTIYHEHVNYFSVKSISKLLSRYGFIVAHIQMIDYMGGSIRVYSVRKGQVDEGSLLNNSKEIITNEADYFTANPDWRNAFRENVLQIKRDLLSFVLSACQSGKRICAIGAATKGNTMLNYCHLDRDSILICCDVSKLKVGKFLPGSGIPIVHDDELGTDWDYGIVLPWNLSEYITEKFKSTGIELVFPIINIPKL